jgi:hypothetical protein
MTFQQCNHTELYQLCLAAEISIHPKTSREMMILYLEGDEEPPELPDDTHPIHKWRLGIMKFILAHWEKLSTQVTCPAKSKDPRACFGCADVQVITCIVTNEENEKLIAEEQ